MFASWTGDVLLTCKKWSRTNLLFYGGLLQMKKWDRLHCAVHFILRLFASVFPGEEVRAEFFMEELNNGVKLCQLIGVLQTKIAQSCPSALCKVSQTAAMKIARTNVQRAALMLTHGRRLGRNLQVSVCTNLIWSSVFCYLLSGGVLPLSKTRRAQKPRCWKSVYILTYLSLFVFKSPHLTTSFMMMMMMIPKSLLFLSAVPHEEGCMQAGRLSRVLLRSWQHRQLPGLVSPHRRGGDLPVWVRGPR